MIKKVLFIFSPLILGAFLYVLILYFLHLSVAYYPNVLKTIIIKYSNIENIDFKQAQSKSFLAIDFKAQNLLIKNKTFYFTSKKIALTIDIIKSLKNLRLIFKKIVLEDSNLILLNNKYLKSTGLTTATIAKINFYSYLKLSEIIEVKNININGILQDKKNVFLWQNNELKINITDNSPNLITKLINNSYIKKNLKKLNYTIKIKINFAQQKIKQIQANIKIIDTIFKGVNLKNIETQVLWQNKKIIINKMILAFKNKLIVNNNLIGEINNINNSPRINLNIAYLNLKDFSDFLLAFKEKKLAFLSLLQIQGKLKNIIFTKNKNQWSADFFSMNLQTQAFKNIPGFTGIWGQTSLSNKNNTIVLNTKKMNLFLPKIYRLPLKFQKVVGVFNWQFNKNNQITVIAKKINIELNNNHSVNLDLQIIAPQKKKQKNITTKIRINFKNIPLLDVKKYIPKLLLSKNLYQWLQKSLIGGKIITSNIILRVGDKYLHKYDFNLKNATIKIAGLPLIQKFNGKVYIDDEQILVTSAESFLATERVNNIRIFLPLKKKNPMMSIKFVYQGNKEKFSHKFKKYPYLNKIAQDLSKIPFEGKLKAQVSLNIPFKHTAKKALALAKITLIDVKSNIKNLPFKHLKGMFDYKLGQGFVFNKLTAEFLNNQLDFKIINNNNMQVLAVKNINIPHTWWLNFLAPNIELNKLIKGFGMYDIKIIINNKDYRDLRIKFKSNLKSTKIFYPLTKLLILDNKKNILEGEFTLIDHRKWQLNLKYSNFELLLLATNNKLIKTSILISSKKNITSNRMGFFADINIDQLSIKELFAWYKIINPMVSSLNNNQQNNNQQNNEINLVINKFAGEYLASNPLVFSLIKEKDRKWHGYINSAIALGQFSLEKRVGKSAVIDIVLDRLQISPLQNKLITVKNKKNPKNFALNKIPLITLKVKKIILGKEVFFNLNLNSKNNYFPLIKKQKLIIDNISLTHSSNAKIKGKIIWNKYADYNHSFLFLNINLNNSRFHQNSFIEKGLVNLDLNWKSTIFDLDNKSLNGKLKIKGTNINIIDDTLKKLNKFDFFALLNIRHFFSAISILQKKDEFYLSKIEGQAKINQGIFNWEDDFKIDGLTFDFILSGKINLITKELDQLLKIKLKIGNFVTLINLLATIPTQGAIWLFNNTIEDALNNLQVFQYSIKGYLGSMVVSLLNEKSKN